MSIHEQTSDAGANRTFLSGLCSGHRCGAVVSGDGAQHDRPLTAIWLKWALAGTALWHSGCFLHTLLRDTQGASSHWLDAACMTSMAAGLLLLTSAVLHAALRMHFSADIVHPAAGSRYLAVYSPLLFIVAVAASIVRSGSRDFIHATDSYQIPYLAWLSVANVTAAALFMRNRNRLARSRPAFRIPREVLRRTDHHHRCQQTPTSWEDSDRVMNTFSDWQLPSHRLFRHWYSRGTYFDGVCCH